MFMRMIEGYNFRNYVQCLSLFKICARELKAENKCKEGCKKWNGRDC